MNCLHQTLTQVEEIGYAHHIQRLMILSNFALIAGIESPSRSKTGFMPPLSMAYDWVMQTNVLGMGVFADGGILASKPYAASANYINKMSDYCTTCQYNPERTHWRECLSVQLFLLGFPGQTSRKIAISRQNGTHPQKSRQNFPHRTSHHPPTSNRLGIGDRARES